VEVASDVDLVTVGEWMPIRFYRNDGRQLRDVTASTRLPPMRGWWYSLAAGDFDGDGRPDLVAGNLWLNHAFTTSKEGRLGVYAADVTGNGISDIILTEELGGTEYPLAGLALLGREIFWLGARFPTHASFARTSIRELLSPAQRNQALRYRADTFASVFLRNNGDGTFTSSALPNLAQIAPIKAIVPHDVDGDGRHDLVVAGHIYAVAPNIPRADAGNGLWLRGDGEGRFTPVHPTESGFLAPLNVSALALMRTPTGRALIVANTGDALQVYAVKRY
jgi:enediyne biosynthesis protein E4